MPKDSALPQTLDLARTLAWIANTAGGWLDREEAIQFVLDLSALGTEAMLVTTEMRLKTLDPNDVSEETRFVLGREQTVLVRGNEAAQHWAYAWTTLQTAARSSEIQVCGRPGGRSNARMENMPATEFGQLTPKQGEDGGSRLGARATHDHFWDRIEILTADVLRLWPIEHSAAVSPVCDESMPTPAIATSLGKPPRRRGPRAVLRLTVERAMKEAVQAGFDLENEKEEVLAGRFGASRSTCRAARDNVLAEQNTDKHRQTSPNDK